MRDVFHELDISATHQANLFDVAAPDCKLSVPMLVNGLLELRGPAGRGIDAESPIAAGTSTHGRSTEQLRAWVPMEPPSKRTRVAAQRKFATEQHHRFTQSALDNAASSLTPAPNTSSAADRKQALIERLARRWRDAPSTT